MKNRPHASGHTFAGSGTSTSTSRLRRGDRGVRGTELDRQSDVLVGCLPAGWGIGLAPTPSRFFRGFAPWRGWEERKTRELLRRRTLEAATGRHESSSRGRRATVPPVESRERIAETLRQKRAGRHACARGRRRTARPVWRRSSSAAPPTCTTGSTRQRASCAITRCCWPTVPVWLYSIEPDPNGESSVRQGREAPREGLRASRVRRVR